MSHPWIVPVPQPVAADLLHWAGAHHHYVEDLTEVPRDTPAAPLASPLLDHLAGPGCAVLRGLPVEGPDHDTLRVAFAAIAVQLGHIVPQTVAGALLYSVRDEGYQLDRDYGQAGVRTSKTTSAFGFHTDSPAKLAGHTPDLLGLFVLQTAKSGGESALADGRAVYRTLAAEHPEALARLKQPFWMDRRAELPPGEPHILPVPVFAGNVDDETFSVRYVRLYIVKGQQLAGCPLTPEEFSALDAFEQTAARLSLSLRLEPGDIQFLDNTTFLHGRTAYEDYDEPDRKRHYLRIWIER